MFTRIKSRPANRARWIPSGLTIPHIADGHADRSPRNHDPVCEKLEGRVVLSAWGTTGIDFLGSLASAGVVTSGEFSGPARSYYSSWGTESTTVSQLNSDIQKLQTELQGLAAKSGITIIDLNNLANDSESIAGAGFWINPQNLQKTVSELVTAVAGGNSTTQAQTDFNNLFTGSKVEQSTITKTFDDLVQTIQDSKITTADLSAVAADQAAVQTDLNNLPGSRGFSSVSSLLAGSGSLSSNLATSLSSANVPALPAQSVMTQGDSTPWFDSENALLSQLNADTQTLQTEKQSLTAKSGVTIADLTKLVTDSETIAGAGLRLDQQSLNKVVNELVTAVTNGSGISQAQSDFNALFNNSNVAQTSIEKTFDDLVQTIQDSKITAADLSTLTADQTAIQTDRTNLHNGSGTSVTSSTSTAGSGSSGSGGSGSGSGTSGTTSASTGAAKTTHFARLRGIRGLSRLRRR